MSALPDLRKTFVFAGWENALRKIVREEIAAYHKESGRRVQQAVDQLHSGR